jgi:ABC-2 type transport system ATP-binding protein
MEHTPQQTVHSVERTAVSGSPPPALRCTGVVKRYEDVIAVDGLDLVVRRGECLGLLGPNGAGKTTTVEILEGLTRPDAGGVEVLGLHWGTRHDHDLRARIGVQLQQTELADRLYVEETIRLFRSFHLRGREVDDLLALLGLESKRNTAVQKLSGGLRQRLALACALVSDPEVLFLDEPTTGLDPQARLRIWEVVEDFRRRGGTVLLTTHAMDEAQRLCDRVAVLDQGRLIALGTPAELIASLGANQLVTFQARCELESAELEVLPGVSRVTARLDEWRLGVSEIGQALPALLELIARRSGHLAHLTTHEASLEDVFIHLTGRGLRDD